MTKKSFLTVFIFVCAIAQQVWAWNGNGTQTDPYLISSSADWKQLSDNVAGGNTYSGTVFRMTRDIDANGVSVGTAEKSFKGIFDGDGNTLTYNRGSRSENAEYVFAEDYCAPFVLVHGATIRHLKVTGAILTKHMYAAGIVSIIDGTEPTTISDCHVNSRFLAHNSLGNDASFGGLIGLVKETCTTGPTIENCTFTGRFDAYTSCCGGFVGWARVAITFNHCLFDPSSIDESTTGCATFVRAPAGVTNSMTECYYTTSLGETQGVGVFNKISLPEGCTYSFINPADAPFNGVDYWKSGATIMLTAPDNIEFDHWQTNSYLSDPWQRSGLQTIRDIAHSPSINITTFKTPAKWERIREGTQYRFLGSDDYWLYLSREYCAEKGYYLDDDGWLVKNVGGTIVNVTVVTGWVPGSIPTDGAQIHNDLVGDWRDHTLMACIAPRAFKGCTELKTLYFKDTDANNYNAKTDFDFIIGDSAFSDCPNLTEVKMMQYTTRGDNHWEALKASQIGSVGSTVFNGSTQAYFSVDASQYQDYMNSDVWKNVGNRIIIYGHTVTNMTVNGANYSYMSNTAGEPLKNNESGHATLMESLRYWNTTYKNFNAAECLAEQDNHNIWYTTVVGCDDSYLKSNNGIMRIYNDPGSYYNYKTLAIVRNAFKDCKELKTIEFWQTNGRSENSYSDLKMVIQNGAFQGCTNLKELRMFYYVQDGADHWATLGPQDVIPGNNIFGTPTAEEYKEMSQTERDNCYKVPADFKILVATDRYAEFLEDPNWIPYIPYLEPVEFDPEGKNVDFELDGLTYGYLTSAGGIRRTWQTVSQDLSWWSAVRLTYEVVSWVTTIKGWVSAAIATKRAAEAAMIEYAQEQGFIQTSSQILTNTATALSAANQAAQAEALRTMLADLGNDGMTFVSSGLILEGNRNLFMDLAKAGIINNGTFTGVTNLADDALVELSMTLKEKLVESIVTRTLNAGNQRVIMDKLWWVGLAKSVGWEGAKYISSTYLSSVAMGAWAKYYENVYGQSYLQDELLKGMRNNILANIHQFGSLANGLLYFTPTKNLIYHTYLKSVPDDKTDVKISVAASKDLGTNTFAATTSISKTAFRDKTNVQTISFYDNEQVSSNVGMGMYLTIPDSAFVGCTNLRELRLILDTEHNGSYALGPENFILGGDNIFSDQWCKAEVDSLTAIGLGEGLVPFSIVIDLSRKQDFLDNESWASLERFFTYESAKPTTKYKEYGVEYAYAYERNSIKKEHKSKGHLVEHTVINGVDNNYLNEHSGAAILINDIGVWNNFQLDGVPRWAFRNNESLRRVLFADIEGLGPTGDSYSDVDITLEDSCFVGCKNLEYVDLLYMVTDQQNFAKQIGSWTFENNHLSPLTPQQIKIGRGVFENSPKARIKMMPQQLEWFKNDSSWVAYKDRFLPCVFHTDDEGVASALKPLAYSNPSGFSPDKMSDDIDLSLVLSKEGGFDWLGSRFKDNSDIQSFADFKLFGYLNLKYVGDRWFQNCVNLNRINLPSSIRRIKSEAFKGCSSLTAIEIPSQVDTIDNEAFFACSALKTIIVRNTQPARLNDSNHFPLNAGMKIYVPDESLDAYLNHADWKQYKNYIVGMSNFKVKKVVTTTQAGELASLLGLEAVLYNHWLHGEQLKTLKGYIEPFDSLTVSGPINGLDLVVLRYLAGCNSDVINGARTDGRLRYLNLANATLEASDHIVYINQSMTINFEWFSVRDDNVLPRYAFCKCKQLETLILPKSLKEFRGHTFEGCDNLKHLAIGGKDLTYTQNFLGKELNKPLEELVFFTENVATNDQNDPWGADIHTVYTLNSQVGDYMSQRCLTTRVHSFLPPFTDDVITQSLFDWGEYFPSSYLMRKDVEGIFRANSQLTQFDEFYKFENVTRLDKAFKDCGKLKSITLPNSIESISADAFNGCRLLDTIRIARDSVPTLAPDAFSSLPANFRILVPKRSCKLYRTKWAQYADHINPDVPKYTSDIIEVTLIKPNTLAENLGLKANRDKTWDVDYKWLHGISGDYSSIKRLKVIGPISATDFDLLRYLAGYCPWTRTRNAAGQLEYIDLYDANIVEDGEYVHIADGTIAGGLMFISIDANTLESQAFAKAYNLKTLILPRTCKRVKTRALQECQSLETIVIGDDMEVFNWDALDDDTSLDRMYILAKKKMEISAEWVVWRKLCNNYNPTFDAFYVRPSLYQDYLKDDNYTGRSWQRTNNVSKGEFNDDESFCAFASHAAATTDDLTNVFSVKGWFKNHTGIKNLKALGYTNIDTLHQETIAPLTKMEQIALPSTLNQLPNNIFANAKRLQSVDLMQSSETDLMEKVHKNGVSILGIDSLRTLVYLPSEYDTCEGTNIVVLGAEGMHTSHYRMNDSLDYLVPYTFKADTVTFVRQMKADSLYSICLPYRPDMKNEFKLWQVDTRDGATIVFKKATEFEPLKPYLVQPLTDNVTMQTCTKQTIPASGSMIYGKTENFFNNTAFRGSLQSFDEKTTEELLAYNVDTKVTPMDANLYSTGKWNKAEKIEPFTAFLLPGGESNFTVRLQDDGEIELLDDADNQPLISCYNGMTVNSVTLQNRTLYKDGSWNTLCLPFGLTIEDSELDGATVKTLSSTSYADGTLRMDFEDATVIEAGKPYLVKWDSGSDIENPKFIDVTISESPVCISTDYVNFNGSFSPVILEAGDKSSLYLGASNNLYYPSADVTINACRAYFHLNDLKVGDKTNEVRKFVLDFNESTGIENTTFTSSADKSDNWYTLDGRKLIGKPTNQGIYIHNGRKLVIK